LRVGADDERAAVAVCRALVKLPDDVRLTVLSRAMVVLVGGRNPGVAVPAGGEWVIVLDSACPDVATVACHEAAHVLLDRPGRATADEEREVGALLRAWGMSGPAADGEESAATFTAEHTRESPFRATTVSGEVLVECRRCGDGAAVAAPTAPGLGAVIGAECWRCGAADLVELRKALRCPACGSDSSVTWDADATPASPTVTVACTSCAPSRLTLRVEPERRAPTPVEVALRSAWSALARAEETARGLGGDVERDAMLLALVRVSLATAARWLRSGIGLLDGDPRAALVGDVLAETVAAGLDMTSNPAAAADVLAAAARDLDTMAEPAQR
jgi:hypothetical protein